MTQGLQVFFNGNTLYSTKDYTWFLLDSFLVPANTSISKSYILPVGGAIRVQTQMVNVPPASVEDYVPNVTVGTNSLTVAPGASGSSATVITVLAEV